MPPYIVSHRETLNIVVLPPFTQIGTYQLGLQLDHQDGLTRVEQVDGGVGARRAAADNHDIGVLDGGTGVLREPRSHRRVDRGDLARAGSRRHGELGHDGCRRQKAEHGVSGDGDREVGRKENEKGGRKQENKKTKECEKVRRDAKRATGGECLPCVTSKQSSILASRVVQRETRERKEEGWKEKEE